METRAFADACPPSVAFKNRDAGHATIRYDTIHPSNEVPASNHRRRTQKRKRKHSLACPTLRRGSAAPPRGWRPRQAGGGVVLAAEFRRASPPASPPRWTRCASRATRSGARDSSRLAPPRRSPPGTCSTRARRRQADATKATLDPPCKAPPWQERGGLWCRRNESTPPTRDAASQHGRCATRAVADGSAADHGVDGTLLDFVVAAADARLREVGEYGDDEAEWARLTSLVFLPRPPS